MSETNYSPGTFCWWELGTTAQDAAKTFYTQLFNWSVNDVPMGNDQFYTMFQIDGKDVCAAYGQSADMQQQGIPPNWLSYVMVDNADESAAKVTASGGSLKMGPFDVMEVGRMAVAQDPTGAVFAMWQPKLHTGAGHVNAVGGVCWNELATRDASAAGDFYHGVFGWNKEAMPGPMEYNMFKQGETTVGGMMQMTEEWGQIPPHWMPYFWVVDCDASAAKATELGGTVAVPPTDIPTIGRFAVVRDPQGAAFSLFTPLPSSQG